MERNCYNGDLEEHAKLCIGDVRSNEIFYHKNYLSPFHNRYRASKAKKDDGTDQCKKVLPQTYVWRQISNYIHHIDGFSCTPHNARFLKLLRENVPGVNDSKPHGVI